MGGASFSAGPCPAVSPLLLVACWPAGILLNAMADSNPFVRDTTAWAMGQVFEFIYDYEIKIFNTTNMPQVVKVSASAQVWSAPPNGLHSAIAAIGISCKLCSAFSFLMPPCNAVAGCTPRFLSCRVSLEGSHCKYPPQGVSGRI